MVRRNYTSSLNHLAKLGNITTNLAEGYFPIDTQERLRFLALVYNVEMVFRFSAEPHYLLSLMVFLRRLMWLLTCAFNYKAVECMLKTRLPYQEYLLFIYLIVQPNP